MINVPHSLTAAADSNLEFYAVSTPAFSPNDYVQVLSAEQTYQNAAVALVRARAQRYADSAALFQALGGGWWNRSDVARQT